MEDKHKSECCEAVLVVDWNKNNTYKCVKCGKQFDACPRTELTNGLKEEDLRKLYDMIFALLVVGEESGISEDGANVLGAIVRDISDIIIKYQGDLTLVRKEGVQ
jgi:hypothetical protein